MHGGVLEMLTAQSFVFFFFFWFRSSKMLLVKGAGDKHGRVFFLLLLFLRFNWLATLPISPPSSPYLVQYVIPYTIRTR